MLTNEVNYGKEKDETLYSYDNSGKGSLVVFGNRQVLWEKKGSKAVTTKQGVHV